MRKLLTSKIRRQTIDTEKVGVSLKCRDDPGHPTCCTCSGNMSVEVFKETLEIDGTRASLALQESTSEPLDRQARPNPMWLGESSKCCRSGNNKWNQDPTGGRGTEGNRQWADSVISPEEMVKAL